MSELKPCYGKCDRCIENEILMYLRKISSQRTEIGFELDKHYCDIANERIRKALAEKAVGE